MPRLREAALFMRKEPWKEMANFFLEEGTQFQAIFYCCDERPGLQSRGVKFLTVNTNLLVFVDFGEIGLVFIASLSYVWAGYHAKTTVEAARQIKQE